MTGRLIEEPSSAGGTVRFVIELDWLESGRDRHSATGLVLISLRQGSVGAGYGDRITVRGRLVRPRSIRNPGGFDYRRFLGIKDIYGLAYLSRSDQILEVHRGLGNSLYESVVLPIRRSVQRTVQDNLNGAASGLLLGILLGEKDAIPDETRKAFRTTGLAHALVISGLHVGLVAVFVFTVLRLCRVPDRATTALTMFALVLYAIITQLQPPVVRATVMTDILLLGRLLGRRADVYNSLGLAALVILVVWPTSLMSLGFQLSFAATFSIVGLHKRISDRFPASWRGDGWTGKWLVTPFCVSVAAQVGTAPLIAFHFQQLAIISLVANLLVVPLLALTVGLGLLAALVGWCFPILAMVFNAFNYAVIQLLLSLVEMLSRLPFALVQVSKPGWELLLWVTAMALLIFVGRIGREWWRLCIFGVTLPPKTGPLSMRVHRPTVEARRTSHEAQAVHGRADYPHPQGSRIGRHGR